MRRPSRLLRALYASPARIYRAGFGRALGTRFLAVTHVGRRSGREYETVLEVVRFDPTTNESVAVSAYGPRADWYRNLQAGPAVRVRTGRMDYVPEHRFLSSEEARNLAGDFCRSHPWEAQVLPRVLPAIGADVAPGLRSPVEVMASLPMVAFRPHP